MAPNGGHAYPYTNNLGLKGSMQKPITLLRYPSIHKHPNVMKRENPYSNLISSKHLSFIINSPRKWCYGTNLPTSLHFGVLTVWASPSSFHSVPFHNNGWAVWLPLQALSLLLWRSYPERLGATSELTRSCLNSGETLSGFPLMHSLACGASGSFPGYWGPQF